MMSKILGLILIEISGTGIMAFSASSFVLYVEDALCFKRSAFFLINSLTILFSALSLPLFKKALTKISPSKLVLISSFFISINYLGFSIFKSYPAFLFSGALNGIFINGISSPLVIEVLNSSFKEKGGKYLSIILSLSTLFSSFFLMFLRFINDSFSYKWGYRLIAFTGLLFSSMGAYLIKGTSLEREKRKREKVNLKNKKLLILCLVLFIGNFLNLALFNNLIPYLKELGFNNKTSHFLSSLSVFLIVFSRLLWGFLFCKARPSRVVFYLSFSPFISSLFFILAGHEKSFIYPSLPFLAFNSCFNALPSASLSKEYKKEGDIFPFLMFSSVLGSASGSSAAALIYDIFTDYKSFWLISAFLSLLSLSLCFYILRSYPHDGPVVSG